MGLHWRGYHVQTTQAEQIICILRHESLRAIQTVSGAQDVEQTANVISSTRAATRKSSSLYR